ncbi:TPA: hypothetical protein I7114_04640 [Vibrio vulnificus]|nr:hypothetical protein [Vibrio vulnificus]
MNMLEGVKGLRENFLNKYLQQKYFKEGLMKKYFTMLLMLSSFISVNAFADTNEDECLSAVAVSSKINNFQESDLASSQSFKACEVFLHKKDTRLASNLSLLVSKKTIEENKTFLQKLGTETDWLKNQMKEESVLGEFLLWFVTLSGFSAICFITNSIIAGMKHSGHLPKTIFKTLIVGVLLYFSMNFQQIYFKATTYYIAYINYMIYNSGDHETIKAMKEIDTSQIAPALKQTDLDVSQALHFASLVNNVTELKTFDLMYGSHIEIDKTLFASGFDISDPTVQDFFDYYKVCGKSLNFVIPDNELNVHLMNFNFSQITTKASFVNGTTDTKTYNCDKDRFGLQTPLLSVESNVPTVIENFIHNNYPQYLGTDLTVLEHMKSAFDDITGQLHLDIEQAEKQAASNPSAININLELAENAAFEFRHSGKILEETPSFKNLVRVNKSKMGSLFDFKEIEGLDTYAGVGFLGIKSFQYNYAELFNMEGTDDSEVEDKTTMGITYLMDYIDQTQLLALELRCAESLGSDNEYKLRQKYAEKFNGLDRSTKLRHAGNFSLKNDTHCFRFHDDGSISAGGKFESSQKLREIVQDRYLAVDVLFAARRQAAMELILENDNLYKEIILQAANSMSGSFAESLSTFSITSDAKQKLHSALKAVEDSLIIETQLTYYNMLEPEYYYDFPRFGHNQNLEGTAKDKGLGKFDFSEFFTHSTTKFVENANEVRKNEESSFSQEFKPVCPVVDNNGLCVASIAEINVQNAKHTFDLAYNLGMFDLATTAMSGICDAADNLTGTKADVVIGKGNPYKMIGCGVAKGVNGLSDTFVKPLANVYFGISVALYAVNQLPIFYDVFLLFVFAIAFVSAFVVGYLSFSIEGVYNTIRYVTSDRSEQDFNEFLTLTTTTTIVKSVVIASGSIMLSIYIVMSLLTMPSLGGAIFDLINADYDNSIFMAIALSIITCVAFGYLMFKILVSLPVTIHNNIMDQTNSKGFKVGNDTASLAQAAMFGLATGAMANLSKVQQGTDNYMNELSQPKKKGGNSDGNGVDDSGKPNQDTGSDKIKNSNDESTDKDKDILQDLLKKEGKDSKEEKDDKPTSGKDKLEKWKDDVDEYHKTKTKTTVNQTGEERTKDALKDHYDFGDKNNEE